MVDVYLGWKMLKMPFVLLATLLALEMFHIIRSYLKDKRKSSHDFMFPKAKLFLSVPDVPKKTLFDLMEVRNDCIYTISLYFLNRHILELKFLYEAI